MPEIDEKHDHICARCGHAWPSPLTRPITCPKCKRRNWWKPKRAPRSTTPDPLARGPGRPPKYYFQSLEVGQSIIVPWFTRSGGDPDERRNWNIHRSVAREEKKHQKRFVRTPRPAGLHVARVA